MAIKVVCDRCGRECNEKLHVTIGQRINLMTANTELPTFDGDLCGACAKELRAWMKWGKEGTNATNEA